jgi:autotransporter-associated beta strand protein
LTPSSAAHRLTNCLTALLFVFGLGYFGDSHANACGNANVINSTKDSPCTNSATTTFEVTASGVITAISPEGVINNSPGSITTFTNAGSISGTAYGIKNNSGATIGVVTNTGTITGGTRGISNAGAITTINNKQGAISALTYTGALPANYNIIVASSANYGKLSITSATGTMIFGVSSLSTTSSSVIGQTLTGVLQGFGSNLSTYISSGLTSSNGYTYSFAEQGNTGIWDLTITACSVCSSGGSGGAAISDITIGTTVSLSAIGVTANPILAGGTLVLSPGDRSSVAIAITSAGGTIQAASSGSATLSGVFSGVGGLTFTGTGTTILSGANTYSGGTTVSSGSLVVTGASATGTGDVFVASAGTLMGTGTIAGNSLVSGVIKPGNSPGYLSITRSLTLNAGSTYQQDIAGTAKATSASPAGASGYYSFVNVGSQLVINSGATLTPRLSNLFSASEVGYGSSIYVPALGDIFRIVTAAGGITGRFTTLTQPAELRNDTQLIAFYNVNSSNSLDLALVPTSYSVTLSSRGTNAKSVAEVLDQLLGLNKVATSTSAQDALLYAAAGQSAATLPTFAQALAGEIHAASAATLPQATQRMQQSVLARLADYPIAPLQINTALSNALLTGGISATNPSGLPTANMNSNPAVNSDAVSLTSAAIANGIVWGEITYQRGDRASHNGGNGYNNNLYQLVLGGDAYANAELGLKVGGGLALSNTSVIATHGNSTIQQGSLFVYGKMPIADEYVIDGMASVGLNSSNLSRNDPSGITSGFSNKSVMGTDAMVSLGVSRPFEYNYLRVTPYARVTYQYVGQAGYDEGSSAAAMSVASFSGSAVRGVIGVAIGSLNKDPFKDDFSYRANVAVGADTAGLLNPTLNTTLGGFSSTVTTATSGSVFLQLGLYGTVKLADNAYGYAGVLTEIRSGQTLYGGSLGLRLAF